MNVALAPHGVSLQDVAEEDLPRQLAEVDPSAMRLAYARHHEVVRAFARRLVGDAAAAEDLVQETFVALPGAVRRASPGEVRLRALLLGICANHARHHLRAAVRRRAVEQRLPHAPDGEGMPGPEGLAARAQLRVLLQRAMDTLSYDHRVVLVLCDVEERTSTEVAAILQIPEATVRTRLFKARRNLRVAFGEEEP